MEEDKISCIGCKRLFQHSGILRHLSSESAKDCKALYTDEALESLKRASRKRRNQLDTERKHRKRQKLNPELLSSKTEKKVISTDYKVSCKVCKRKFLDSGILKHISNTKNCKLNYPKKDLSKLEQLSVNTREIKLANWRKEHKHERLKYYNPRNRAEQYLKDKRKISGEYQQHKAFMKHKERSKKVAEKYYQNKHKWASKEGKAFSVASDKVFENVWDSIYDRHLDEAIEKVRDDKDLHLKVLDKALENTMAWKWQQSFYSKYRDCDGLSRIDCDKAFNPSNKPCICNWTQSEADDIYESSMEEAYKEALDIEEQKAAKTFFNNEWEGPLEESLNKSRNKFMNKGFNKFFDGLFQTVYNDAYDRAFDKVITSEKVWREDKGSRIPYGSPKLIMDLESDHVFATHEEIKKICCQKGEFTKEYSNLIFSLIDKEYGLEMLHRRKKFNKRSLNLHLSFKEKARKSLKKLERVNFPKDKQQEIRLVKKQAQNLSKELDNEIDDAVESGEILENDFPEVSKLYDELMKAINSKWDEINKKVSTFMKDKVFIDKFPPYTPPGEPCNCLVCMEKNHKMNWPFCTRICLQQDLQREDLTCPNCFKDIAKDLIESHIDECS